MNNIDISKIITNCWETRLNLKVDRISIDITNQCDERRCPFCTAKEVYDTQDPSFMTKEQIDCIFRWARSNKDVDLQYITFHGGEPFIHWDILKYGIMEARRNVGEKVIIGIHTNGRCITQEQIQFLLDHNVSVLIGLKPARYCSRFADKDVPEFYYDNEDLLSEYIQMCTHQALEQNDDRLLPSVMIVMEERLCNDTIIPIVDRLLDLFWCPVTLGRDVLRFTDKNYVESYITTIGLVSRHLNDSRPEDIYRIGDIFNLVGLYQGSKSVSHEKIARAMRICNAGRGTLEFSSNGNILPCVSFGYHRPDAVIGNLNNMEKLNTHIADDLVARYSVGKNGECRGCEYVFHCKDIGTCLITEGDGISGSYCEGVKQYFELCKNLVPRIFSQNILSMSKKNFGEVYSKHSEAL